jgi:hypothetical protein
MTTRTQHKAFALRIGAFKTEKEYEDFQRPHEEKNARIRAARAEWQAAIGTATEDEAAKNLDAAMAS